MFLKAYLNVSDRQLIERFNTDYSLQMFCGKLLAEDRQIRDTTILTRVRKYIEEHCEWERIPGGAARLLEKGRGQQPCPSYGRHLLRELHPFPHGRETALGELPLGFRKAAVQAVQGLQDQKAPVKICGAEKKTACLLPQAEEVLQGDQGKAQVPGPASGQRAETAAGDPGHAQGGMHAPGGLFLSENRQKSAGAADFPAGPPAQRAEGQDRLAPQALRQAHQKRQGEQTGGVRDESAHAPGGRAILCGHHGFQQLQRNHQAEALRAEAQKDFWPGLTARSRPDIRLQRQQKILHRKRHIHLLSQERPKKTPQAGTDTRRRNIQTAGNRDGRRVRDPQGLLRAQEDKGQR